MNDRNSNGAAGAAALGGLIAAVIAVFVIIVALEIARIYMTRAWGKSTTTAQILWGALVIFAGIVVVAWQLIQNTATQPTGIYTLVWSFFVYVVVCEGCDWYERRNDPNEQQLIAAASVSTDDYIKPWDSLYPGPSLSPVNGRSVGAGTTSWS